ncbi:MAG TPA: hypothetical protein VGV89_01530 [Thermoplasmata archaeon]|nr:hypothetical protein [Thermoplasmata archaeon]
MIPATLDRWSQDPNFVAAQERMKRGIGWDWALLETTALRLGEGGKPFCAEDVLDAAGGRELFPKNLIGCVLGNLRNRKLVTILGREKSHHPAAKGRWINVFVRTPRADQSEGRPAGSQAAGSSLASVTLAIPTEAPW